MNTTISNFVTMKKSFFGVTLMCGKHTAEVCPGTDHFFVIAYKVGREDIERWYPRTEEGYVKAAMDWLLELYKVTRKEAA